MCWEALLESFTTLLHAVLLTFFLVTVRYLLLPFLQENWTKILNKNLATALCSSSWVSKAFRSFHYWQPAPRQRLENPGNTATSPHAEGRKQAPATLIKLWKEKEGTGKGKQTLCRVPTVETQVLEESAANVKLLALNAFHWRTHGILVHAQNEILLTAKARPVLTNILTQVGGDWNRVSCHGNAFFYSHRCVSCRTVSLPSFDVLHCKLAKIALFTYSI